MGDEGRTILSLRGIATLPASRFIDGSDDGCGVLRILEEMRNGFADDLRRGRITPEPDERIVGMGEDTLGIGDAVGTDRQVKRQAFDAQRLLEIRIEDLGSRQFRVLPLQFLVLRFHLDLMDAQFVDNPLHFMGRHSGQIVWRGHRLVFENLFGPRAPRPRRVRLGSCGGGCGGVRGGAGRRLAGQGAPPPCAGFVGSLL